MTARTRIALLAGALALSPIPAHAATLLVAVNGTDSVDCGTKTAPCRSIRRAVILAGQGDTIQVSPGRYGDIARDGTFVSPGDEAAEVDTGCDCMLHVDKRVAILSRDGAGATVLDAGGAPIDVVKLDVPGSVFGAKGKGFTVTGGGSSGIASEADGITIAGNVAAGNVANGIDSHGDHVTIADNRLSDNGNNGCGASGTDDSSLLRNVATNNGDRGFTVDNRNTLIGNLAARNGEEGFNMQNGNTAKDDVSVGNTDEGFSFNDDNVVSGCVAHGNQNGFRVAGENNTITKTAILANNGVGIIVAGAGNVISKSNVFGNAGGAVNVPNFNANCGLLVTNNGSAQATQNFWGTASGPGLDPADLACVELGSTLVVLPAATKEAKVRPAAAR